MSNKNHFLTGINELLILSILSKHDTYVYEIIKAINEYSEGLLNVSQNTIYTAIYKLELEKKISSYSKVVGKRRTRIYYHLEPLGNSYLEDIFINYKNTITSVEKVLTQINKMEHDTDEECL